jgi:hypothetical protein
MEANYFTLKIEAAGFAEILVNIYQKQGARTHQKLMFTSDITDFEIHGWLRRIWGYHGGGHEEFYLLRYNAAKSTDVSEEHAAFFFRVEK